MPATPTTGQLASAQRTVIARARYTMEQSMANVGMFEKLTMPDGASTMTVPKVGQFTFADLVPGVDLEDEQDIGMSTVDLTTGEVGAKIILTDKLVRQEAESVFAIVGRQFGDAAGRKRDTDVIALYPSFNGGVVLGADNKNLTLTNLGACIAFAKANKYPGPVGVIHHPNAVYAAVTSAAVTPSATYGIPRGMSEDMLNDFYQWTFNRTPVFEDGNIDAIAGYDSGYGVIASMHAACTINSRGFDTERERDISLRATEVVAVADYGVFELDDGYAAAMQYEIGNPATNN